MRNILAGALNGQELSIYAMLPDYSYFFFTSVTVFCLYTHTIVNFIKDVN